MAGLAALLSFGSDRSSTETLTALSRALAPRGRKISAARRTAPIRIAGSPACSQMPGLPMSAAWPPIRRAIMPKAAAAAAAGANPGRTAEAATPAPTRIPNSALDAHAGRGGAPPVKMFSTMLAAISTAGMAGSAAVE